MNKTPSDEIDQIIKGLDDWRGEMLARLRSVIVAADANLVEEVKWKKPSRPEGVPVWSCEGNVCIADALKNAVRLTFPKGAQLADSGHLFNTRLDSKTVRAIDFTQDMVIDEVEVKGLLREAIFANTPKMH